MTQPAPQTSFESLGTPALRLGRALADLARDKSELVAVWHALARHLEATGAPLPLARAARRAALDAIRHARMVGAMARRYRTEVTNHGAPTRAYTADMLALTNAIDGCVRQTWDLERARWAADHAPDPAVRETMRRIARDQTEHVALAWRVHGQLLPRAGQALRERVDRALRATVSALDAEISRGDDRELVVHGLLPPPERSSLVLRELRARACR
jgi:hypothetical protein